MFVYTVNVNHFFRIWEDFAALLNLLQVMHIHIPEKTGKKKILNFFRLLKLWHSKVHVHVLASCAVKTLVKANFSSNVDISL